MNKLDIKAIKFSSFFSNAYGPVNVTRTVLLLLLFLFFAQSEAQITFAIEKLPENTPEGSSFFMSGALNKWKSGDPTFKFYKHDDGNYYTHAANLQLRSSAMSFMVTRGNWETVECENSGLPKITRKISYKRFVNDTVFMQIDGWSDLINKDKKVRKVTIYVTSIPRSTPPDAPIYITGNFNGWIPGDTRYKLKRNTDEVYSVTVPAYWSTLEYKFTRGNWHTVEGKAYGRPRLDRITKLDTRANEEPISCSVLYWEDQSSSLFNPYTLILILTAIQGILLLIIVNTYENNNRKANQILSALILLLSIALVSKVVIYDRDSYNYFPRLSLVPDIVYFLYAPLFLIYIRRLLNAEIKKGMLLWGHFIPFLIQIIFYLYFFIEPTHLFVNRGLSQIYPSSLYIAIGAIALTFNIAYWFKIRGIITSYLKNIEDTYSDDQNVKYLFNIITLKAICLVLWLVTFVVGGVGKLLGYNLTGTTNILIDVTWVVFSFTVYLLGYFAIKQPEIFKIAKVVDGTPYKVEMDGREIEKLKTALHAAMKEKKVYLEPTLSLPDLAESLNSNVHELSRVINEGFHKNFRDYVNSYRIDHFVEKVNNLEDKNKTYLGIALEVGFNSKSSFNRSFKKIKGISPREFFQSS